jgi:DNA polymerase epsilon subunit 2
LDRVVLILLFSKLLQIVLGDKSEQKAFKYTGITCFNPGSFANDSTFAAYRPCTKEVELSALEG